MEPSYLIPNHHDLSAPESSPKNGHVETRGSPRSVEEPCKVDPDTSFPEKTVTGLFVAVLLYTLFTFLVPLGLYWADLIKVLVWTGTIISYAAFLWRIEDPTCN